MTPRDTDPKLEQAESVAEVWIGHQQALVVGHEFGRVGRLDVLDRGPAESEAAFDLRAVEAVIDEDRVLVEGPTDARIGFERAYVAITHRPDRLADVQPMTSALDSSRATA